LHQTPKGNEKVLQPSIFRCELLVPGRVKTSLKSKQFAPHWCGKQLPARPKMTKLLGEIESKGGKNKAVYDPLTINQHVFFKSLKSDLAEVYRS